MAPVLAFDGGDIDNGIDVIHAFIHGAFDFFTFGCDGYIPHRKTDYSGDPHLGAFAQDTFGVANLKRWNTNGSKLVLQRLFTKVLYVLQRTIGFQQGVFNISG